MSPKLLELTNVKHAANAKAAAMYKDLLGTENPEDAPAAELSKNAYGVSIFCAVQGFDSFRATASRKERMAGVATIMYGLFLLGLNLGIQLWIIIFSTRRVINPMTQDVQDLYHEFHDKTFVRGFWTLRLWKKWPRQQRRSLCQIPIAQTMFFLILLMLWSFFITGEVRRCMRWLVDTYQLPSRPPDHDLILTTEKGEGIIIFMTSGLRVFILVCVVVPELFTASVLWYIGCWWLTGTLDFSNLILNSVALSFVANVDEMIYQALVPEEMQMQVARTSVFTERVRPGTLQNHWTHLRPSKYLSSIAWFGFAMLMVYFYLFKWEAVLPDFQWDLKEPCSYIRW